LPKAKSNIDQVTLIGDCDTCGLLDTWFALIACFLYVCVYIY
jgi:hypothetical protein